MDFLKLLRSFEEFLFEVATWIIFYPLTLWRILRHPLSSMAYSEREQAEVGRGRYDDALSPPLLLLFTLVLMSLIGHAAHVPDLKASSELTKMLSDSPQNLILFRSTIFSLIPLLSAATLLRRQRQRLTREALRDPFYAQCYLVSPFAAVMSLGSVIVQRPDISNWIGAFLVASGTGWFLAVQTIWFRERLSSSWLSAAVAAGWALLQGVLVLLAVVIMAVII